METTWTGLGYQSNTEATSAEEINLNNKAPVECLSYEERLANARAIAQKFAQQAGNHPDNGIYNTCNYKSAIDTPWFQRKLHLALIKNYEYVYQKDTASIQQLIQVQQQQQQQSYESTSIPSNHTEKQAMLNRMYGTSGIGSHLRESLCNNEHIQSSINTAPKPKTKRKPRHSIYIQGLNSQVTTDQSLESDTSYIDQLFSPFGKIINVQQFFHSGAVIVSYDNEQSMQNAIAHMNGATMSSGHILSVSMAKSSSSGSNKQHEDINDNVGSKIHPSSMDIKEGDRIEQKENEEEGNLGDSLDDFFSSL